MRRTNAADSEASVIAEARHRDCGRGSRGGRGRSFRSAHRSSSAHQAVTFQSRKAIRRISAATGGFATRLSSWQKTAFIPRRLSEQRHCSRRTHDGRPSRPLRLRRGRPPRRDRRGTFRAALPPRRFPRARVAPVRSELIGAFFLRRANDAHQTAPITRARRRTARLAAPSKRARHAMTPRRPLPSSAPPSPRSRCSPPRSSPPRTSPRPRRRSPSPRAWRARRLPSSSPRRKRRRWRGALSLPVPVGGDEMPSPRPARPPL